MYYNTLLRIQVKSTVSTYLVIIGGILLGEILDPLLRLSPSSEPKFRLGIMLP
jgi:hypothetical protein